jgi:hypothetical protein
VQVLADNRLTAQFNKTDSIQRNVPNTVDEYNVPTDEPSLQFRGWYYRAVKLNRRLDN